MWYAKEGTAECSRLNCIDHVIEVQKQGPWVLQKTAAVPFLMDACDLKKKIYWSG
jgi:hypothetical protein